MLLILETKPLKTSNPVLSSISFLDSSPKNEIMPKRPWSIELLFVLTVTL